ncbi:MAG: cation:proton antiporter, partial [Acidimicrobiales bacterium]|nr:cation:proton antiporter [Acidimicrobiales bacterium]
GELGVVLLLLSVGMEMDLGELTKVGRASMMVAIVGVVAPMAMGFGVMSGLLGADFNTSLFIGAALTATSVGITARVFGDLRALATTEARVVLGAAVADDVMGLVVLTVVVRLVTEGSVSALSVLGIIGAAVAFLVIGAGVGLRLADPIFSTLHRITRATGTTVAVAFVFALVFARAAAAAKLAPIVGAFVAGLALTRSRQSSEIHRELAPVGHLLIPVFFLQIGTQAEIERFASVTVLRDAGLLLLVAAVGKLLSPLGAIGIKADKPLIGLGMLPRGEVGLIFATLGKASGVLDDDLYASLLLVVLLTTLITPQLLKLRYARLAVPGADVEEDGDAEPRGGWLRVNDTTVDLTARPPAVLAPAIALEASVALARREPGAELTTWITAVPDVAKRWRPELLPLFIDLIERGNARSWRFLDVTGVLPAMVPALHAALDRRRNDGRLMDPLARYRLDILNRLHLLPASDPVATEAHKLLHPERLMVALFLFDVLDATPDSDAATTAIVDELALPAEDAAAITALVHDADLLWSASLRTAAFAEENVMELATHLGTAEQARALFVATAIRNADAQRWQTNRLRELYGLLSQALAAENERSGDVLNQHRSDALTLVGDAADLRERVTNAPRSYLLRQSPAAIARQASILRRPLRDDEVRVTVGDHGDRLDDNWSIDVASRDRHGLLTDVTGVLADHGLSVLEAVVATWPDGVALEAFRVRGAKPDADALARDIKVAFTLSLRSDPIDNVEVVFDNTASPWYTICEITAPDQPGLLHTVSAAFTAADVEVVAATVAEHDGVAHDRFELIDKTGRKLAADQQEAVTRFLAGGVTSTRHWFRQRYDVRTDAALLQLS